ncbi:hypothetical protein HPP92_017734 [Vanilla planifolia]|uniref:Uncharacterized protein n=1 Tax=Vanilla planifolia TaxID=51239 RepID=A0A835QAR7_VANPL|nr:hypothetical protein HPP92_017734 [Vanilla planifolia]
MWLRETLCEASTISRGVDEENLVQSLPKDLRRRVPLFEHMGSLHPSRRKHAMLLRRKEEEGEFNDQSSCGIAGITVASGFATHEPGEVHRLRNMNAGELVKPP